jgi:hypothetical protein
MSKFFILVSFVFVLNLNFKHFLVFINKIMQLFFLLLLFHITKSNVFAYLRFNL